MNSVANGKIRERTAFREVYIQPASGDNGTALGAAFDAWHALVRPSAHVRDGARLLGTGVRRRGDRRGASRAGAARFARAGCTRAALDDEAALEPGRRRRSPRAGSSAGSRDGWSGAPARSATAASSPTRAAPTCATSSTRGSSSARSSGRSRRRSLVEALDDYFVGAVPDPFMLQVYPGPARQARGRSGRDARRRFGPPADGQPRDEPALLDPDPGLRTRSPACRCC